MVAVILIIPDHPEMQDQNPLLLRYQGDVLGLLVIINPLLHFPPDKEQLDQAR